MRHKLLSLIALFGAMFMSMSAMAQWTEPTPPAKPTTAGDFTTGHSYFIRNVGCGQYITGSNSWSTQISVTKSGIDDSYAQALLIYAADSVATLGGAQVTGITLRLNGTFTVNGDGGERKSTNTYLFRDSEGAGFIDYNDQGRGYIWKITKVGDYYRIQTADGDPSYPNSATQYAGWDDTDGNIEVNDAGDLLNGSTVVKFDLEAGAENAHIDWEFIPADDYPAQVNLYNARLSLYNAYTQAVEDAAAEGVNIDEEITAAQAVYDNANATIEELKSAEANLTAAVNAAVFASQFYGTEDDPQDVTDICLKNPTFDSNIDGWTITVQGQNLQWQGRTDGHVDETKNWVSITNFIEAWISAPNHLGDGTISQTIYGLPAGKYILECDAMATLQGGSPSPEEAVTGAYIFIEGSDHEQREPIKAPDTQPKHWSVTFINGESKYLTFGLKVENTTANWISADNFRLWFLGETTDTPEMAILKSAISEGTTLQEEVEGSNDIESYDNNSVSADARQALQDAISNAESALSGSAEDMEAAKAELDAAIQAVKDSKNVYKQFKAVYTDGNLVLERLIDAQQWDDLQGDIEDFLEDDLRAKFEEGALSADQLEEYQTKISFMVRAYINDPSKIQVGDDLSILLVNPGFTQGTTEDPTGWTINSGSMGELRQATQSIETWHKSFDMSQTIANMPAGVYDITLQGFARHDGDDTDKTWLYGGMTKQQLISLNDDEEQMRTEPIYSSETLSERPALGDTNFDNTASNGMYKANGMTGAYYWFNTENPNTGEPYYTNHIEVVLAEDGDLTIGIHCETGTDWVIFTNFAIKYAGMNVAVFAKMVKEKQAELENTLYEVEESNIVSAVMAKAQAQLELDADNIDNAQDALAAIEEIENVIALVKESNEASIELATYCEYFNSLSTYTSITPDASFLDAVAEIQDNLDAAAYATIDELKADSKKLIGAWSAAIGSQLEPGDDATEAILNPYYYGYNVEDQGTYGVQFWTTEGYAAANYAECEFFNNTTFNHYQNLTGMKAGYYTLSLDGFYRYGDYNPNTEAETPGAGHAHAGGTEELNALMYVHTSAGSDFVVLPSIFDGALTDAFGISGEVTAEAMEGYYIPNSMECAATYLDNGGYNISLDFEVGEDGNLTLGVRKNQGLPYDWTIFKNWNLKYLGTDAPDAVKGIETQTAGTSAIYGIDGRQQTSLRRGINIVRKTDGQVQKVLVK